MLEKATIPIKGRPLAPSAKRWKAIDFGLLVLLMLLGLGLRVWNVSEPTEMFFDEVYYVDAAEALWRGDMDPNSVHPPLSKWLIGLGMRVAESVWGPEVEASFSWRLGSFVAGTLMVGATYGLALLLFDYNRPAAALSGFFVATEHLHLSMSRIAMLDPFLALFCLLGIWASFKHFLGGHERWAVIGAFLLGLATGCKWSGLFTAFACFIACWWLERGEETKVRTQRYFFWLLLLVPLGFFLCYFHLFWAKGLNVDTFMSIFDQGERMVNFRRDTEQFKHGYLSFFWQWPAVLRPIWLHYEQTGGSPTDTVEGICSLGVPIFWWGFLVLLVERSVHAVRRRDSISGALVLLYLGQWLPWAVSYTGGFFYYMLPEVPIMACLMGKFVADLANLDDSLGEGRWRAYLLLGAYLAMAAAYYPFVAALDTPRWFFSAMFCLPNWI